MSNIAVKSVSVRPAHECKMIRFETAEGHEVIAVSLKYSGNIYYPWEVIRGEEHLPATKLARGRFFNKLMKAQEEAEKNNITLRRQLKNTPVVCLTDEEEEAAPVEVIEEVAAPVVEEEKPAMSVEDVAKEMGVSVGQIELFKAIINETSFEYDEDTDDGYIDDASLNPLIASKSNGGYLTQIKKNGLLIMSHEFLSPGNEGYWVTVTEKGKKIADMLNLYIGA